MTFSDYVPVPNLRMNKDVDLSNRHPNLQIIVLDNLLSPF
jgi:hypothetical protein